jgi:hypothetical protein
MAMTVITSAHPALLDLEAYEGDTLTVTLDELDFDPADYENWRLVIAPARGDAATFTLVGVASVDDIVWTLDADDVTPAIDEFEYDAKADVVATGEPRTFLYGTVKITDRVGA